MKWIKQLIKKYQHQEPKHAPLKHLKYIPGVDDLEQVKRINKMVDQYNARIR